MDQKNEKELKKLATFLETFRSRSRKQHRVGGSVERRRSPRQDVRGLSLKVTLILKGGSLINKESRETIEIDALPIDLSPFGISLSLNMKATWETITPKREIDLCLERGRDREIIRGRVRHVRDENQFLGLEFVSPLKDMSRFIIPTEMR